MVTITVRRLDGKPTSTGFGRCPAALTMARDRS